MSQDFFATFCRLNCSNPYRRFVDTPSTASISILIGLNPNSQMCGIAKISTAMRHRCPLKQKAAVIGMLRPLTPGLSHALLALQEEDGEEQEGRW
jgi:hypothetical protein